MVFIFVIGVATAFMASAQRVGDIERIAAFLGVSSEEELSEDEMERLGWFIRHPLKINMLSKH